MKRAMTWAAAILLASCSSVTPIPDHPIVHDYGNGCRVTVYQTEADALEKGDIVEMCVIDGTSAWSLNHTAETAIKKHAKKACECGADKVYVQSRAPMGAGPASASMIAFRWKE